MDELGSKVNQNYSNLITSALTIDSLRAVREQMKQIMSPEGLPLKLIIEKEGQFFYET